MFDLSIPKLLILAVIALVIFGPKTMSAITAKTSSLPMDRSNTLRSPSRW